MYTDSFFMHRAIELAKKGTGFVSPNPLVGAVIVKENEIIGEGFHKKYGEYHAEVNAILDAEKKGNDVTGSTMYVTLEPCAHTGKTPSCAKLLVEKKIKKVIIASRDPNPKAGGGIEILEKAGIEVENWEELRTKNCRGLPLASPEVGARCFVPKQEIQEEEKNSPEANLPPEKGGRGGNRSDIISIHEKEKLAQQAKEINKGFFSLFEKNRPFFTAKVAISKNGMVAEAKGKRTQITGKEAQIFTHQLRMECDAILVGAETVVVDDPELSVRNNFLSVEAYENTSLQRILIDPNHRIPKNAKVFRDNNFVIVSNTPRKEFEQNMLLIGAQCLVPNKNTSATKEIVSKQMGSTTPAPASRVQIDLQTLVQQLKNRGILRVLIEGGPTTLDSFFKENLIDELYLIQSPNNLPKTGVPLFPNGFPKGFMETEKKMLGEDIMTRYSTSL
jgi:riboflavin-specific deaminase-like protein